MVVRPIRFVLRPQADQTTGNNWRDCADILRLASEGAHKQQHPRFIHYDHGHRCTSYAISVRDDSIALTLRTVGGVGAAIYAHFVPRFDQFSKFQWLVTI